MGTEIVIYAVGCILGIYLMYMKNIKERDITLGNLLAIIFIGLFSWLTAFLFIIAFICENEDKVIIKKKEPKKKEEFEENIPLLEEHKK